MQILILRANYRSSLSHVRHTYIQFQIQSYHFSYSKMSHMHTHILSILACIQQFIFHMYHKHVLFAYHAKIKSNFTCDTFHNSIHVKYSYIILKELWQKHSITYIHIYCTQHKLRFLLTDYVRIRDVQLVSGARAPPLDSPSTYIDMVSILLTFML